MAFSRKKIVLLAAGVLLVPALLLVKMKAHGSDHADTPAIAALPGTDLTDLYIFPSPTNSNNVVLAMCVHPLIPTGMGLSTVFDPNVLYQFKIDTNGDSVEDLVIQAKFTGIGANQQVQISGPVKPSHLGTQTVFETPNSVVGTINNTFTLSNGMKVFAGAREDPFFIDLNQLYAIFPDRKTPLNGIAVSNPNTPQAAGWNPAGTAKDFLKGFNVLAIVVELPKTMLQPAGSDGKIRVWITTSK
ncbi:MAG TPA: DUF4331 family protein [Chthonomonadaceae bacterium]|nr:DUF4331 family protein [Chthonomonadaceae bacterium]